MHTRTPSPAAQWPARQRRPTRAAGRRGSVLIVALLLAALIAVALGSYLSLNGASTRFAKRTFDGYAALNLAEAGGEEAIWSFNRGNAGDASAWNTWTRNGAAAWQKFTGFDFGQNTTGWVKVYVDNSTPSGNAQPTVVAQSFVGAPGTPGMSKMLEITLRRRSLFANGLVGKESVVFAGTNASVDSWNSDPDGDPATPPVPYSAGVRNDRGSVATLAVVNSAALINQANVWGYVATGGGQPQVGANGTIRGATTPAGVAIDPSRISTDFTATLDVVPAPTDGTFIAKLGSTLGTAGTATKWRTPNIALSGNDVLTILGNVTLVLTAGTGTQAISVTGNASIVIADNSSLVLYFEGDARIAGRGLANSNTQPATCQLYGTTLSSAGQSVDIAGNGALKAVFYGPNDDLRINGNGDVMGAFVARNVTLTGNAAFHFDESLGLLGNSSFGMVKWRELTTAADMSRYSAQFDGW